MKKIPNKTGTKKPTIKDSNTSELHRDRKQKKETIAPHIRATGQQH